MVDGGWWISKQAKPINLRKFIFIIMWEDSEIGLVEIG
jgi:hypothetical protein